MFRELLLVRVLLGVSGMGVRVGGRTPPFCPNPQCPHHRRPKDWRWKKAGFYSRHSRPRIIQRFQCLHCHRLFSTQTFSTTYWLRMPNLLPLLFHRVLACSALRQIARELDVAPSTVMRQVERLARHCFLFQATHQPPHIHESLVLDGFESFEFSQYYPFHFNLAVGANSHFCYGFTDAPLRRKGRMTSAQKHRRAQLETRFGRPDPKAVEKGMAELLRILLPQGGVVDLRSDEHPAYPRALRRVPGLIVASHKVTSSRRPRITANPLFPVNLLDLLIRHCSANHKRETIAFSKRRQAAAERMAILQVWRNFMKPLSEKARDASPAERIGLMRGKLRVEGLLDRRLFPGRLGLAAKLMAYYRREIRTLPIPNGRTHLLKYAF